MWRSLRALGPQLRCFRVKSAVVDHLSDAPGGRFRRGDRWKRPASGRNPSIDLYWQNLLADAFGGSRLALYIVTYFLGGIYDEC